jgi:hypothetical protein
MEEKKSVGRPRKYKEKTVSWGVRCPISKAPELKELINCKLFEYKKLKDEK